MHDIVTKETWSSDPDNAPLPSDFNRIESNTRKVEENRQEETTARGNADTTLQNNIDSEATARANADNAINADLGGLDFVNGNAGTYGSKTIVSNETWVIPKGLYFFTGYTGFLSSVSLRVKNSDGDFTGSENFAGGMLLVDGVNFALTAGNQPGNQATLHYRKLA